MNRLATAIRHLDWWLMVPTLYLVVLGSVIQNSILFKDSGIAADYDLLPHVGAAIASISVALIASYFRPISWLKTAKVLYIISLIVLVILLLTGGEEVARWLQIGAFRFQPTEIVKLVTVGVLAGYVSKEAMKNRGLKVIGVSALLAIAPALLIALQPSLGSALVFAGIWSLVMLASPVHLSKLGVIGLTVVVAFIFALPLLKPYQAERISSFLNPTEDSQGSSYNSIQAGIAIGSGGLLGSGLDSGSQSQLNFLPAQHTDFAFAVTAEKLGLIGAVSIIFALTALLLRLTYLAWSTSNMYWRLLLIGVVAMFLVHTVINIGMNVGILPVTGLPLPFISYGGTFLFVCLTSVLLANILSYKIRRN